MDERGRRTAQNALATLSGGRDIENNGQV